MKTQWRRRPRSQGPSLYHLYFNDTAEITACGMYARSNTDRLPDEVSSKHAEAQCCKACRKIATRIAQQRKQLTVKEVTGNPTPKRVYLGTHTWRLK